MKTRTYIIAAAVIAVIVVAAFLTLAGLVWQRGLPEGLIQVNGRMEGDHVTVSSKFPGRVIELAAREGAKFSRAAC
jgi:HlyD family secretion protein